MNEHSISPYEDGSSFHMETQSSTVQVATSHAFRSPKVVSTNAFQALSVYQGNGGMKMMQMSEDEMMNLWRLRTGLMPLRRDCTLEREDGIDVELLTYLDMREWYARLLKEAPIDWLPCRDAKENLCLIVDSQNVGHIIPPEGLIRPVSIKLKSWNHAVAHIWDCQSPVATLQQNFYSRGNAQNPVVIAHPQSLKLYSCLPANEEIEEARFVAYPEDGSYEFAEIALSTIPKMI